MRSIVNETPHDIVTPQVFAEAADAIAAHKLCGRDVVVVSASERGDRRPDRPRAGRPVATRMIVEDGRVHRRIAFCCYEGKAQAIRELAASEGTRYGTLLRVSDSITDLPMLEAVGHASVVSPDRGLRKETSVPGGPCCRSLKRMLRGAGSRLRQRGDRHDCGGGYRR